MAYGVRPDPVTAGGYESSADNSAFGRAVFSMDTGGFDWKTASSGTVAVGTDIAMTTRMSLSNAGLLTVPGPVTVNGLFSASAGGSQSAPRLNFTGDPNTGIYNPAADTLSFTTAGTRKMVMSSTAVVVDVGLSVSGTVAATGGDSNDWNAAFGWGDHALGGYPDGTGTETISGAWTFSNTVAFSGATLDMAGNTLTDALLEDYQLENTSVTPTGTTQTITYATSQSYEIDLESATGNVTVTISGGPTSGKYGQMIVKVTQDSATVRTITWAGGTFRWAGGSAHAVTTSLDGWTLFSFETWDGGTSWYGSGADYN